MVGMFGWEGFDVRNASLPDEVFCLVREIGQMVADEARGEEEGGGDEGPYALATTAC